MSARNITEESILLKGIRQLLQDTIRTNYNEEVVSNLFPIFQESFAYNINDRLFNTVLVGSGAVSVSTSTALLESGTITGSTVNLLSKKRLRYRHGESGLLRFSALYFATTTGTTAFIGMGSASEDGFFFGFTGTTFGVLHRNSASGLLVTAFIAQADWNRDNATSLITTNLNSYDIQFKAGEINYFVNSVLVHVINSPITVPILGIPNLPFRAQVDNGATTDAIDLKVAHVGLFIEGIDKFTGVTNSKDNEKTLASGVRTSILTIRNKSSFNSKVNTNIIIPRIWTIGNVDNDRSFRLELVINTTLGGVPVFTDIDTNNSVAEFDVAGTTATGGDVVMVTSLNEGAVNEVIYLETLDFILAPTDTLTLAGTLLVAGNFQINSGISWKEDI